MAASMMAVCCPWAPPTTRSWKVMVFTATCSPFHCPLNTCTQVGALEVAMARHWRMGAKRETSLSWQEGLEVAMVGPRRSTPTRTAKTRWALWTMAMATTELRQASLIGPVGRC